MARLRRYHYSRNDLDGGDERMIPAAGSGARLPKTVVLEGDPREIGVAHGRLLRDDIRALLGEIGHRVFRRVDPVRGLGLWIVSHLLAAALNARVPASAREELRGISSGSGVPYPSLLLMNVLDDVLNILRRFAPRAPSLGCSSFALFGRRTADGSVLHGRNLDYHFRGTPIDDGGAVARLLLSHAILFVYRPSGRAAFLSVGWPGTVGVSTAFSREGIALGSLTSYMWGTTPFGIPATMLYREIVEEATTLRDAGKMLRSARRTIGNNLLVSSGAENRAALFEITRDAVSEIPDDDGMLIATNHFVDPPLAEPQKPYLLRHSVARWERLRAMCDRDGVTVPEALAFLADTACAAEAQGIGEFARIANDGTAVSVLFQPAERVLWLGTAPEPPASRGAFERLAVDGLFSAEAHPPTG